jgi:hypothetical protein
MYPNQKVWDKEAGAFVDVANAHEAVNRDPERYSLQQPAEGEKRHPARHGGQGNSADPTQVRP